MNQEGGRVPPQAVDVERQVLGGLLYDEQVADIIFSELQADVFYNPANRMVFEAARKLYNRSQPIDILTVETLLKDMNTLDQVGGVGYLADLGSQQGATSNTPYYCSILAEKAMRRKMILACNEIIQQSYDTATDTADVIDIAQERMFAVTQAETGTMRTLAETMQRVSVEIEQIQSNGKPIGLRTGLDIDTYIQGFQKAKLYVLGARPSMGKTALVMTLMRRMARDHISCGILSLETSDISLGVRLITQTTRIPADRITSGNMSGEQMKRVIDAYSELSELGIIIDDEPALTAQKVRAKCRLLVRKGVKIVFIDFLQLMQASGRSKHEEIGSLTKALKQISKELDIPIVVLSQLSRKVEDRTDKRPQMADLRESGSIEEDADVILFLYRPEYYGITTTPEGESTHGMCDVIIAKNKDGKTGLQRQKFIEEHMRFENYEYRQQADPTQPSVKSFYEPQAPTPHQFGDDETPF